MRDTRYSISDSEHGMNRGMNRAGGDVRSPRRRAWAAVSNAAKRRLQAVVTAWERLKEAVKEAVAGQLPQVDGEPVPVPVRVKAGSRRSGPDARA